MVASCPVFVGWLGFRLPFYFLRKFGSLDNITCLFVTGPCPQPNNLLVLINTWLSLGSLASLGMAHDLISLFDYLIPTIYIYIYIYIVFVSLSSEAIDYLCASMVKQPLIDWHLSVKCKGKWALTFFCLFVFLFKSKLQWHNKFFFFVFFLKILLTSLTHGEFATDWLFLHHKHMFLFLEMVLLTSVDTFLICNRSIIFTS